MISENIFLLINFFFRFGLEILRWRISFGEAALVPIRIRKLGRAGGIEFCDLLGCQIPADCAEVGAELLLVPRANDEGRDRRAMQEPIECNLRNRLAGFFGDFVNGVDDFVEVFIGHLRADVGVEL